MHHNTLIPELAVTSCDTSLKFYCNVLGFTVTYSKGRTWTHSHAPLEKPLCRGINLQIKVESIASLLSAIEEHNITLFLSPEEKWYHRIDEEIGHRQFIVADPDGYLLRFYEYIGIKEYKNSM